jgi:dipeptidyl aminopeptidase/acylaminoacyl peptidase
MKVSAFLLGALLASASTPAAPSSGELTPRMILSVNVIQDVELSPDGKTALYELRRTDWEGNRWKTELWLVGAEPGAKPRKLIDGVTGTSPYRSVHATWRPDGRAITYFLSRGGGDGQIWSTDVETGVEKALTNLKGWKEINPRGIQPSFLKWSPDGSRVAFVMSVTQPVDPNNDPGDTAKKGYDASVYYPNESYVSLGQLWVLTAADGTAKRVSRADLSVTDIEWSPDGKRMVVSAMPVPKEGRILNHYATNGLDNDLYLLDLATGEAKPLVAQPGWEEAPVWSPDGRWIAFQSQRGVKDWNYTSFVGVVSADGGPVRYLDEEFEKKRGSTASGLVWDARSAGVYFTALYRGRRPLFHVNLDGKENVEEITPGSPGATYFNHYSLRPAANVVACSGETVTTPDDLYVSPLDKFAPRVAAALNPEWPRTNLPAFEEVEWKNDGLELHGYLLTPPGSAPGKPLPAIVYTPGGPSMVRTGFQFDEGLYPFLTWATRGYAVFVPNNRGRNGWGLALRQAMPLHSDYVAGPYRDVMAGIDMLVARGAIDPARLGISGFSFGGALTSYIVTQTDRFKAASIGEGAVNPVAQMFGLAGQPDAVQLQHDQRGYNLPWDPAARKTIEEQAPLYLADRVKTPCLLEYGVLSEAKTDGVPFFNALQHFGVPSKLIVYPRTGHGPDEPLLYLDSFERNVAWFDQWLRAKK